MLREIDSTRQIPGEPLRRWFTSAAMDLIVWYDASSEPSGFQLCFDKYATEHALTWRQDTGFSHTAVDDGDRAGDMCYKATPILIASDRVDAGRILGVFMENSLCLPASIVDLVRQRLLEHIDNS